MTTSLWLAESNPISTDPFVDGEKYDEVIVGAGLTGLVTALLFARAGKKVAVLEARFIGATASGNTTAKLSLLQGSQLQSITSHTYQAVTQAYVDGNRAGQRWLLDYIESRGIAVQFRDAVSYAGTPDGVSTIAKEYRVARSVGLDVRLTAELDLPFETFGAVVLPEQAQFDPLDVLTALAADVRALGGVVVDQTRVVAVKAGARDSGSARVRTSRGEVSTDHVHLTTGSPILDRGLYFAKLSAKRSYVTSYTLPGSGAGAAQLPEGMFLSVDSPSRSLRTAPVRPRLGEAGDGVQLLVGGNGHPVGREPSTQLMIDDLHEWTERYFPGAQPTHSWSAQDYETPHRVPFVGWLPRGRGRIYLATGYDKWGMTNAVMAALTLVSDVLGDSPEWAVVMHHRATLPVAIASGLGSNAAVGWWALKGWAGALLGPGLDALPEPHEREGLIGRAGLRPTGVSTVDGRTCAVSAVCPHLGGVLTWNNAEASWDCPLHGSRFDASGALLEGPATRDLKR
ncbi:FAD-dependent oxidoreductase [Subtercola vilae]|uniref:FAD-dependent oxidoreductase n=1 Tax=Subtercola vilae TaxID=2056433 RepID=A0A4V6U5H5_9MICO|nr:FAD-dependent oxidoreductase [Subtercola vilae]TIH39954.1 FAD-dependent oxidoreductase [Subtercola vilae]